MPTSERRAEESEERREAAEAAEWEEVKVAAPMLRMSEQALYAAVREGQLPPRAVLRIGRRIRINLAALRGQAA